MLGFPNKKYRIALYIKHIYRIALYKMTFPRTPASQRCQTLSTDSMKKGVGLSVNKLFGDLLRSAKSLQRNFSSELSVMHL